MKDCKELYKIIRKIKNHELLDEFDLMKFAELLRDEYDYYYPYNIVETNGLIYQLYYARKNNTDYQYLSVMNPSTNEFIYEGRIILRSDQGLVNNYQLKSLD